MKINYNRPYFFNPKQSFSEIDLLRVLNNLKENIIKSTNTIFGQECVSGSIIASPSVPEDPETDQNYVFDWVRDSALCILSLAETYKKTKDAQLIEIFQDYVNFVRIVQANSKAVTLGYARWNLNGTPSPNWTVQNDGPALRVLALCQILDEISDAEIQKYILKCIRLDGAYIGKVFELPCFNIWEETNGCHFFTKAVIRKALIEIQKRKIGIDEFTHDDITEICEQINILVQKHWTGEYYKSQCDSSSSKGSDINIDVIMGLAYGELLDDSFNLGTERSIKTISRFISKFQNYYPLNWEDARIGIGPNLGRYPEDYYDGDLSDGGPNHGHPWFISTNIMAYCFYRLAEIAKTNRDVLSISRSVMGLDFQRPLDLVNYGNRFTFASKHHWDNGRMSEQYDRETGFMKSVRDLSWSYASYIMSHWKFQDAIL